MKESRAILYPVLSGIAGGLLAWSGVEWLLAMAPRFPDYRFFFLVLGGISGLLLGAVAPAAEGLRQSQGGKIASSMRIGALLGAVAGALGMLLGQLLLSLIAGSMTGESLAGWSGTLARLPGWAVMGAAVGAASGVRSRSGRRMAAGLLGGFIGGLLGGFVSEIAGRYAGGFLGRGIGMVVWGLLVAVLADRFEARRSRGRLTVLSGPLKGRSFPVNQRLMTVAAGRKADLTLPGKALPDTGEGSRDTGITRVEMKNGAVVLESPGDGTVLVNGEAAETTQLKYDDVIKVGDATIIYEAGR